MVAIFVALMFIGFVLVDLTLQKVEARRAARVTSASLSMAAPERQTTTSGLPGGWEVPETVYLAGNHAWLSLQKSGRIALGADALLTHILGTTFHVVFAPRGQEMRAGEPLFQLELNGFVLTISSPISGVVSAVNTRLEKEPELLAQDPYGAGWVLEVEPSGPSGEANSMRLGQRASAWLEAEFGRFREFLATRVPPDLALGATSQDGGLPAAGCMALFGGDLWAAFEAEFLRLP